MTDQEFEKFNDNLCSGVIEDERELSFDDLLKRMEEQVGQIDSHEVARDYFFRTICENQNLAGIQYHSGERATYSRGDLSIQTDLVMKNDTDIVVVKVEYKAEEKHLDRLLTDYRTTFETLFTEYSTYNHHYALASFYFTDDLKKRALENGIIVIERKGKTIETFVPVNR